MIRVILDANVLISYLLNPDSRNTVPQAVDFALSSQCLPIVPSELLAEVVQSCTSKPYLMERISSHQLNALVDLITDAGYTPNPLSSSPRPLSRDIKDDYLLAYSLLERVDFLVTGDVDLISLGQIGRLQIVTPAEFLDQVSMR